MLHTTRAIVLHYTRFRETSIIVKAYTERFGAQTYIVNGVRSATGRQTIGYYQPLSLLTLVAYHKPGAEMNRISQAQFFDAALLPSQDIRKTTVRLFLAELLLRALREPEPNPGLFEYVFTALLTFEHAETGFENFHLQFILGLSRHLGFGVTDAGEVFHQVFQLGTRFGQAAGLARQQEQEALQALLELPYLAPIPLPQALRRDLLELLVRYMRLHIEAMPELRTVGVLQDVFGT